MPGYSKAASEQHQLCKSLLRSLTSLCAVAGIGLVAWVSSGNIDRAVDDSSLGLLIALIPFALTLIWNIINIVFLCCKKHPIHPGFNVAAHLILFLWTLGHGSSFLLVASAAQYLLTNDADFRSNLKVSNANLAQQAISILFAIGALFLITALAHFVLFVWACVDTHRRRRADRYGGGASYGRARDIEGSDDAFVYSAGGAAGGGMGKMGTAYSSHPIGSVPPLPEAAHAHVHAMPLLAVDPAPYARTRSGSVGPTPSLGQAQRTVSQEGAYVPYRDGQGAGGVVMNRARSASEGSFDGANHGRELYRPSPGGRATSELSLGREGEKAVRGRDVV